MSYPPRTFTKIDHDDVINLITHYPLATILSACTESPLNQVCQIPLFLDQKNNCLLGHIIATNPLSMHENQKVKLLFNGPNAYLSPNYCKQDILPSWLYATVEVTGTLTIINQHEDKLAVMHSMTEQFERQFPTPWQMDKLSQKKLAMMFKHLSFVRINIETSLANYKLNQNKSMEVIQDVINSMMSIGEVELAELIKSQI